MCFQNALEWFKIEENNMHHVIVKRFALLLTILLIFNILIFAYLATS